MSDPGSETGATNYGQVRPSTVIIPQPRPLTCGDFSSQATCPAVCSVVVLGVGGSSPLAHPMRMCC
jgi:hypothetical protein